MARGSSVKPLTLQHSAERHYGWAPFALSQAASGQLRSCTALGFTSFTSSVFPLGSQGISPVVQMRTPVTQHRYCIAQWLHNIGCLAPFSQLMQSPPGTVGSGLAAATASASAVVAWHLRSLQGWGPPWVRFCHTRRASM